MKNKFNLLFIISFILFLFTCSAPECQNVYQVKTGLDIVVENEFKSFAGHNIGIVCNHSSRNKSGKHIVDLFHNSKKCTVKAIFAPEHGFRGQTEAGRSFQGNIDSSTGIPIYSLYNEAKSPTSQMLKNIDILIYDIQDVGARFYTYISTMSLCMEAAAQNNIEFYVLDRPNPIRGDKVSGPILQDRYRSFVGLHPIPIRYGLTIGELANFINYEGFLKDSLQVNLKVIKMDGWQRKLWYDLTDLNWISPSPNITNLTTAIVYPGMCLIEGTNLSEGRGTTAPFLQFGAPWLNAESMAEKLSQLDLPGVKLQTSVFIPQDIPGKAVNPRYKGQQCEGFKLDIIDRDSYQPLLTAVSILYEIYKAYPDKFEWRKETIDLLVGSNALRHSFQVSTGIDSILYRWQIEAQAFKEFSSQYYLYE